MEKFLQFEIEHFLNDSKTKSIRISSNNSTLEKISILFELITKDANLKIINVVVLYKYQWLKFIKKEQRLIRKIMNRCEQNRKKKVFTMNQITVSTQQVDGARGLVIAHNGEKFVLNRQEVLNLMNQKSIIKRNYNVISRKIRLKALSLVNQIEQDCKNNKKYTENVEIYNLKKKLRILTLYNDRII